MNGAADVLGLKLSLFLSPLAEHSSEKINHLKSFADRSFQELMVKYFNTADFEKSCVFFCTFLLKIAKLYSSAMLVELVQ